MDAFNDPDAASDLATYRSSWGLPACGAGCFSVVNENGATSPLPASAGTTGWDVEESLDIDMVSAACPLCHIILVEASSASTADLGKGVNAAVSLGAKFVSNSYGGPESSVGQLVGHQFLQPPGRRGDRVGWRRRLRRLLPGCLLRRHRRRRHLLTSLDQRARLDRESLGLERGRRGHRFRLLG